MYVLNKGGLSHFNIAKDLKCLEDVMQVLHSTMYTAYIGNDVRWHNLLSNDTDLGDSLQRHATLVAKGLLLQGFWPQI